MEKEYQEHQILTLKDRVNFTCELVENVEEFSSEQITFNTKLGCVLLKGSELCLEDFSADRGIITVDGKIDSFCFTKTREKKSFLKGLFR